MKYYPAFLDLSDKKAVVVGGGRVAERKVRLLLHAGASITVISPDITAGLGRSAEKGLLQHRKRNYRKGDLKDSFIVIAATSSRETNIKVARDARHLVNVIDVPSEGNFIVPSVVKRGPLTIAVSTEGSSPAISKAIRKEMERHYTADFGRYLRFVEMIRNKAMRQIVNDKKRETFLKYLASDNMLDTLRIKGFAAVKKQILLSLEKIT